MQPTGDVTMQSVGDSNRDETLFCTPIAGSFSGYRDQKAESSSDDHEGISSSSDEPGHFRAPKERSADKRNARSIMSGL